jgi:hypothetical protein
MLVTMQDAVNEMNKMNREPSYLLLCVDPKSQHAACFTGDRLHENSRSWLSPPDPSDNQVIARRDNHDGSAVWLTRGSTFEEWNAKGCLLWIYGKRT